MNIEPGQDIPLVAHLECPDGETYFVQAEVLRPDRSNITGSPIQLTDEGDGRFFNDTLSMPDESFITVTYRVFLDAGLTEEALDEYCPKTVVIGREAGSTSGEPIIVTVRDRIIAKARSSRSKVEIQDPGTKSVRVVDPDLAAQVQSDQSKINSQENSKQVRTQ